MSIFTPKPLIDDEGRRWIHLNFEWFSDSFKFDDLTKIELIRPTKDFFPFDFDGSMLSVQKTIDVLCEFLSINKNLITLQGFTEKNEAIDNSMRDIVPMWSGESHGAAGTYQESGIGKKFIISIKKSKLNNPVSIIGTIAHELCHIILLGENRVSSTDPDMEPLTDLLTVYYGLGIFTANAVIQTGRYSGCQGEEGWQIERQGYLPQEYFGYALALWTTLRNEWKPDWLKYLSVDIKEYCKKSIKLLSYEQKNDIIASWKKNKEESV